MFPAMFIIPDTVPEYSPPTSIGTDQDGPMMSMEAYRTMIKPHHRRLFGYIKSRSKAKIVYHTCGSVVHLIPDLIETDS
jgi:uroporphyrinogen decarboxylase